MASPEARIERAARAAFPGRSIAEVDPRRTRPGNETGLVRFETGDPAYLKTATDTTTRLVRETAALRYADAHCPVGTPSVLAADPDGDPPYLVTAPLGGTPLNDPWTDGADREPLLRAAGEALARVHEATFERPGVIEGGDGTALTLAGDSWTETLCATVEWRASDWYPDRFADVPERLVDAIREVDPTPTDAQPALLHCDCSRINLHLDPPGLVDWERALVGDPAFDLVDATGHLVDQVDVEDDERPALTEALYEGYGDRAGGLPPGLDGRRPLYRAVAHLLVTQTFDKWAARVDVPDDELAADVREEFDERLAAAREATNGS